jgi:hypothetical protein
MADDDEVHYTYASRNYQCDDEPTVAIRMTEDEARSLLEALNEPALKKRAFAGLSDQPFQANLQEIRDVLIHKAGLKAGAPLEHNDPLWQLLNQTDEETP